MSLEPRFQIVLACFLATLTAYVERVGFSIAFTEMAKQVRRAAWVQHRGGATGSARPQAGCLAWLPCHAMPRSLPPHPTFPDLP